MNIYLRILRRFPPKHAILTLPPPQPVKVLSGDNFEGQEFETDASTTAMGDCEAFDLCAGSCGNMLEAVWVLQDDSGDDEDKAAAAAARTNYESFCALQDFTVHG